MNKKIFLLLITVVTIVAAGFLLWRSTTTTTTTTVPLTVAKYYWPGMYWVEIADQKGWFKESGLNVKLVDANPNYFQSLQDTVDGKIDANEFGLFDLIKYLGQGSDMVAVLSGDRSLGAEGIVAKNEIKSIADLRGKKIGVSKNTYLDFILDTVIGRYNISNKDITKINILGEDAAKEFSKGSLDAVVAWEPILSEATQKGSGHKIFDTSQIPGVSVGVWAFRRDVVARHPEEVQKFVRVWRRTADYIKTNPDEAFSIIAKNYGVTKEEVKGFADIDKILDRRDNTIAFSYASGFESFHGLARHIEDFLRAKNLLEKNLDSTNYLDSRFIRALDK